jgi:predicted GTPase
MLDTSIKNIIDVLVDEHKEYEHLRTLKLVLVGKSGVGKSSMVNSLLGCELARVDRWRVGTHVTEKYFLEMRGINLLVFDTPGLCRAYLTLVIHFVRC